jgi:hypothetical protein
MNSGNGAGFAPMETKMQPYKTFLKSRRTMERAIGQTIVALAEAQNAAAIRSTVTSSDKDRASLVALCGRSRERIASALAFLRANGLA